MDCGFAWDVTAIEDTKSQIQIYPHAYTPEWQQENETKAKL